MDEEILLKLHKDGLEYFDLPDFETFKVEMQDENKLNQFRTDMSEYYDMPDIETFKIDLGGKETKYDDFSNQSFLPKEAQEYIDRKSDWSEKKELEKEMVDERYTTPVKPGGDISFQDFDMVSEEDLVTKLEKKYGDYLEFSEASMGKDVIDVTNKETGKVESFTLNTDYNKDMMGKQLSKDGREIYNDFLKFANESRFDERGGDKSNRYLEGVVLDKGAKVTVTPEITRSALELVKADKTGVLEMDDAINQVVESEWGAMHIKWKKDLLNKKVEKDEVEKSKVRDLIRDEEFNINFSGDTSSDDFNKNVDILVKDFGMPSEVTSTEYDKDLLELRVSGDDTYLESWYDRTRDAKVKENIRNWLETTEQGQLITEAYNTEKTEIKVRAGATEYYNQGKEEYDVSDIEDPIEKEIALRQYATMLQNEATDNISDEILLADFDDFNLSKEDQDKLFKLRDQIIDPNIGPVERARLQEVYHAQVKEIVGDNKINLLRNFKGDYIDTKKQSQSEEVEALQLQQVAVLQDYLFSSNDELNNVLNKQNAELYTIAKELQRKGYGETMAEGSIAQQIGEGLNFAMGVTFGVGEELAYLDFMKINEWMETGEMPVKLTTLPTGNDPLLERWNELLQDRSTLVLAKSLNVDPSTFGRAETGLGRMVDAMNENWFPAIGGEQLGEAEMRNRFTRNILERELGFELTEDQKWEANLQIGSWEKAGATVPGFARMGAEMALTYALTGGVGNLTNFISGVSTQAAAFGMKRLGLSLASAKVFSKYATGVGVEYVGLLGSNTMAENVFRQEGLKNPLLFAMGSRFGHGLLAKTGNMYSTAISKYAANHPRFRGALDYVASVPGTASALGAIKSTIAPVGGVVGIKTGELAVGSLDVIVGEKSMSKLWDEITDVDSLMETYMALMFMKGSRPDQFVKGAVETFRHEVDVIRGNNPGWNKLRRSLGLKSISDKDMIYAEGSRLYQEVDAALEIKEKELKEKNLPPKQYQEQLRILRFSANRLKLKPGLDQISREFERTDKKFLRDELTSVAKNLSKSGVELSVDNILVLSESGWGNGGSSPIIELMANGFTEVQATNLYKLSQRMQTEGMTMFGNEVSSPGFKKYVKESIKESQLDMDLSSLEQQKESGSISSSAFEIKREQIELKREVIDLEKRKLINQGDIERAGRSAKTVKEYREAGFEIIEGGSEVIAAARKEIGGKFKETEIGLQGINPKTGKGVILINTEAQARFKKGSTVIHEAWHFPFEKKLDSMSEKDALKYIEDFEQELKKKGLHDQVLQEMFERGPFANNILKTLNRSVEEWNILNFDSRVELYEKALKKGMKMPLKEAKEFINEFLELEHEGRFDYSIGEKRIKEIKKENKEKEVTEVEFESGKDIVGFVMSGGTRRTGVVEALVESKAQYEASKKGKKAKESASERGVSKTNKEISDRNKKLELKAIDKGKLPVGGRIRDIKNEALRREIEKDLIENNLPKVRQLAKQAANSPGALRLEKNKRVSEEEFISGYSEELTRLAQTYKPRIKGVDKDGKTIIKEIPFGGYIQGPNTLKRRYNKILADAKAGKYEGKEKRIGEPVAEGKREFDIKSEEATPEEAMIAKERKADIGKEDRQISVFEGKEAGRKQKEILEVFKDISPAELIARSKKGLAGTPKEDLGRVGELLFDVPSSKITDGTKNLTYAKKIVNVETGKPVKKGEKGIPEPSEMGNIQKYFSDVTNLKRALKTLPLENITGNESIINKQGEIIDVSRDVKGKGLKLPKRFLNYFYEKTGKRSQGLKSQPQVWKLKSKFVNPSEATLKKIQKDLLIGEDFKLYDRTKHGQLAKGLALVESMKVANEATRKDLPAETKAEKQLIADIKAGASEFSASERLVSSIREISENIKLDYKKVKDFKDLNKREKEILKRISILEKDQIIEILQVIEKAKREPISVKETVEEVDLAPGEKAALEKQYTAWKAAYPEIAKKFGFKDIEYITKPESVLFEGDLKERNIKNLQTTADIFPSIKSLVKGGASDLAKALEAFLGFGNIIIEGKRLTRERINELLKDSGKGKVEEWMTRVYQPNWNAVGLKKQWKEVLKEANEKYDPKSQEFKDFLANNARDILTHPKLRSAENGFELTQEANRHAIEYLLKGLRDRYAKKPSKKALEDLARLLQLQTNHQRGILGGLIPMEYVTMKEAAGSKDPAKTLHNEHMKEKFNISDTFLDILAKNKNDLKSEKVNLAIKKLVGELSQALTTYEGKLYKDSKEMGGAAKSNSANKMINTFLLKGSAETSLALSGKGRGKTVADQFIEDYGVDILKKQLNKYEFKDLNTQGIEIKQRIDNNLNYNKIKKETVSLVKESKMNASEKMPSSEGREKLKIRDKAFRLGNKIDKPVKKARVFDFDDTIAKSKSNVLYTMPNGRKGKLTPAEFAAKGDKLLANGAKFDFSEFNKVVEGKKGPLFELFKKMKEASGERDMFVLTARAQEAGPAIKEFLKEMGIDIPLENIKGLGDSSPYAKSDWLIKKAAEGYNDFYFADDHLPNVRAVKEGLSPLDVKVKVQQAKESLQKEIDKLPKDQEFNFSMRTKRDLEWKPWRDVIRSEFKVGDNTYTISLNNKAPIPGGKGKKWIKGDKIYELSFGLKVDNPYAKDPSSSISKMGIEGTGRAAEVLSIVSNGVFDFVKKNKVDAIGFNSGESSRTRLYDRLTKLWADKLGWEHGSETFRGETPETFLGEEISGSFIISKPGIIPTSLWKGKAKIALDVTISSSASSFANRSNPVKKVLSQLDIKGKVQRAKMNTSERLDKDFNKILEGTSGIEWYKEYSDAKAKVIGIDKGKRKFFLPPTAEDFLGLLYPTLGKGKVGEKQMKWYQDNLLKPYSRATDNLSTDRINLMNDFKALKKQLEVPKELKKKNKSGFTNEQAVRVYLWDKTGQKVSGLSKKDLGELLDIINDNAKLKSFADQILETTKGDGYSEPGKEWLAGTITTDLINLLNTTKRNKYLEQWKQNVDIIFSKKNLNKLEAIYGPKYREALENTLSRMKSGRNRTGTGNRLSNRVLDYINNAQGAIMFLNMRSAILQTISAANFVNVSFNNPIKAGRAFANQKQYWKDFVEIMNSDYLVDRRKGLKLNISESEIADAAAGSSNKAKAAVNYILEKGYLPTKFADSFAIATGGATWYRNRIKDLVKKEGLSEIEAKKKAFEEFRDIAEQSQQSSDPSKISPQQSSDLGRVVLQFVNTPMQYTRLQKRAFQDLKNKRGDWKSNISKILYYGVVQNLWFNAMQQGLFALGFGDDEISDKEEKKLYDTANGMADSILRGIGMGGMTVSVLKNTLLDIYRRSGKSRPEFQDAWIKLLEFSPAIKSKMAKLKSAGWPFDSKKRRQEVFDKGFSLDNPAYESLAKVISAATNVPLDRLFTKYHNLENMVADDTEMWESIASFLGWPEWQLDEGGDKKKKPKDEIKTKKEKPKKQYPVYDPQL